jgi:PAS domain S-box-containing protein
MVDDDKTKEQLLTELAELRKSNYLLDRILDGMYDALMVIDRNYRIVDVNNCFTDYYGWNRKEIIGKTCYKTTHNLSQPCTDNQHPCPMKKVMETRSFIKVEHTHKDKYGKDVIVDIYSFPLFDSVGEVEYIVEIQQNITERKKMEERLRISHDQLRGLAGYLESVREEERRNIARKIHDELGQMLTGLKIDLSWLTKGLSKEQESLLEKTKSMSKVVNTTIQTVKRIAAELRPGVLDDLGISAAIEWQTGEFEKLTEIKSEFFSKPTDIILDQERTIVIFRVFQEILTNIINHANATKVKVSLKEEDSNIVLKVKDNGKGISNERISDPKSFGLIGMRERVRPWKGKIKISSAKDKGTTITVSIPYISEEKVNVESTGR